MTQSADKVLDHFDLFRQPEYKEMLENKRKRSNGFASGPRPPIIARRTSPGKA